MSGENIVKGTENICLQVRRKNPMPCQGLRVENTSQSCASANAIRSVTDYLVVHSCMCFPVASLRKYSLYLQTDDCVHCIRDSRQMIQYISNKLVIATDSKS